MGHINGSMEESDAGSNVGNDGLVQDVAEDNTSKWPKNILVIFWISPLVLKICLRLN